MSNHHLDLIVLLQRVGSPGFSAFPSLLLPYFASSIFPPTKGVEDPRHYQSRPSHIAARSGQRTDKLLGRGEVAQGGEAVLGSLHSQEWARLPLGRLANSISKAHVRPTLSLERSACAIGILPAATAAAHCFFFP